MKQSLVKKRKIKLTESQIRLYEDVKKKNGKIQKLIFAEPEDIIFDMDVENHLLVPVIGADRFGDDFVKVFLKKKNGKARLYITINDELRDLGIQDKLHQAFKRFLSEQAVNENSSEYLTEGMLLDRYRKEFANCHTPEDYVKVFQRLIGRGLITVAIACDLIAFTCASLNKEQQEQVKQEIVSDTPQKEPEWIEAANDAIITVYNAEPGQCNDDCEHTASMFHLNLNDVASHRVCAVERTFMQELGLKYGDVIKIEGTYKGRQDGVYQVQDTMNKRFGGNHKIDILVPPEIRTGGTLKGKPAKVYVLKDKSETPYYRNQMAPSFKKMTPGY